MAGKKKPPAPSPAPEPQPEPLLAGFLTQPQLIRELNKSFPIDKRTFQRWEQRRTGPPRVTLGGGRTILYSRDSVLAWIKANESKVSRGR
jgi:hypothetical protein